jgi:hypothetical protein
VYTDPEVNRSDCRVNSSANEPAKSSRIGFGAPLPLAVSVSAKQSHSLSRASDGIGLSLPTELAFELALCRKSGDNWKFPLCDCETNFFVFVHSFSRMRRSGTCAAIVEFYC